MPQYACIGVQADQRPLVAMPIRAATSDVAGETAWRILRQVPDVGSVEVYQGVQLVWRTVRSDRVAA